MPASTTLDHITIVSDDFEASRPVYDAVLGALGLAPRLDYEDPEGDADDTGTVAAIGYGEPLLLWLVAGLTATAEAHVALSVTDPAVVEAAHQAAVEIGARVVQAPREWESAQLNYYGTQLADPAGNIIEVLFRKRPGGS
jgi:catechol 2,3-dioxygenase-like lactoylglutathione lyase family enzyme